jgi:hypothetical protein
MLTRNLIYLANCVTQRLFEIEPRKQRTDTIHQSSIRRISHPKVTPNGSTSVVSVFFGLKKGDV